MGFLDYLGRNRERVLTLSLEHLVIVLEALAIGTVIGLLLGAMPLS